MALLKKSNLGLSAILLLLALPGRAESNPRFYREGNEWVEETTGVLTGAKFLRVRTMLGNITVTGGTSHNVSFTVKKRFSGGSEEAARRAFDAFRVSSGIKGGDTAFIGCVWVSGRWHKGNADIMIDVPRNLESVKINTDGGNLRITHIAGSVDSETGGGNVNIDDVTGPVSTGSGGGEVQIGKVAGDLTVRTGGGNMYIDAAGKSIRASSGGGNVHINSARGSVEVDTGGGNIEVRQAGAGLRAQTGGGTIDIGDVSGAVALQTGGGSIRLMSGKGKVSAQTSAGTISCMKVTSGLVAQTGSGGIRAEFIGTRKDFSSSHLETGTGDIIVYLPSDLAVNVQAAIEFANGHNIHSEFPELKIHNEGGNYGPREIYGEGELNGGGPVLKIHTTTGNIELRKIKR